MTLATPPGLQCHLLSLEHATQAPAPAIGNPAVHAQMALHALQCRDFPALPGLVHTLPGRGRQPLLTPAQRSLPQ